MEFSIRCGRHNLSVRTYADERAKIVEENFGTCCESAETELTQ